MAKKLKVQGFIIDPQDDFMDDGALPVPGAKADMDRLAKMITRLEDVWNALNVTLDQHQRLHIAHKYFWQNQKGKMPDDYQMIFPDDVSAEIWLPKYPNARPKAAGGKKTLQEYALEYTTALKTNSNKTLMIWPVHCLIAHPGSNIYAPLAAALDQWADNNFATINYVAKGSHPLTEHFGGLKAEVPLASDSSTGLRVDVLESLSDADIIFLAGEALSHCVMATVNQIVDNIDPKLVSKFHIIRDCTSPVPQPPGGGPDFPALAEEWLVEMEKKGMHITTSDKFLK
jgi:nicotinamidase/pyrazinamidase